jgi:probable aminopeptidase NPEPL1
VAKAFPIYSAKTTSDNNNPPSLPPLDVHVTFYNGDGNPIGMDFQSVSAAAAVSDGVRLAANLMDTPPEQLTTETFADQCKRIAGNQVRIEEIVGEQLRDQGYGGLWGVGKAATVPPRLLILSYDPPTFDSEVETVALVGKGIVYDTGGLSLKTKEGMPGMKHDMGGAAGLLGAFYAAIRLGVKKRLRLVLCLAENSIGPRAVRNDDILTLYSGKTVEINNSDAEGRGGWSGACHQALSRIGSGCGHGYSYRSTNDMHGKETCWYSCQYGGTGTTCRGGWFTLWGFVLSHVVCTRATQG